LGLRLISTLVKDLQERFLGLVNEVLHSLSDLLDDANVQIQIEARELLTNLGNLTGENLENYMQTGALKA
jgi:hypothetical protein